MGNYLIKDLNKDEKPREKLLIKGVENLTNSELIAILIRTGGKNISAIDLSRELLKKYGNIKNLVLADVQELIREDNINVAKATCLKALGEVALRVSETTIETRTKLNNPQRVYELIRKDLFGKKKEHLYLLSLDVRNRLISKDIISIGTINETLVHPREILKKALEKNAFSMILVHNHPSNDANPSSEDITVTRRISRAGNLAGIPLMDHLIVTDKHFVSIKSLGLLEKVNEGKEVKKDDEK